MTNREIERKTLKALVQKCEFKEVEYAKIPTIDFVYPDYTLDTTREDFRFDKRLRNELAEREPIVRAKLKDKNLIWAYNTTIPDLDKTLPRLDLEKITAIYPHDPFLFAAIKNQEFDAYIVRPIICCNQMAWFELTNEETEEVQRLVYQMAEENPVKLTMVEKIIDYFRRDK